MLKLVLSLDWPLCCTAAHYELKEKEREKQLKTYPTDLSIIQMFDFYPDNILNKSQPFRTGPPK